MHNYEIEIKSLLAGREQADELIKKLGKDPSFRQLGMHKQLNHYFVGGDLKHLFEHVQTHLKKPEAHKLTDLNKRAKSFSVRTRQADKQVILVIKATVDDTTSENGTARLELEAEMPSLSLAELDEIVLHAGFQYQAKWSRERQDFQYKNLNVSIDKNAGYGFLAEFEAVIADESQAAATKARIRAEMADLGVEELPQDRLARMFDYYNKNWQNYYGTDKTFTIK